MSLEIDYQLNNLTVPLDILNIFGIISWLSMFIDNMPKSKFHHPDFFPEGGASIQSTACYSEQYARQFFQVFHPENQIKSATRSGFQDPSHILTHRFWG
ncbi:MAG: hypothetical protein P1U32_09585 [Legionellaceae bacterium]|nr:hypothetical protein [Legionellaceae bacterium]